MLITFLASIVSDPNARAAFIENPDQAMKNAALSAEHVRLLRMSADDPAHNSAVGAAITAELASALGPAPMWPGPSLHLTDVSPATAVAGSTAALQVVGTYFEEGITISLQREKATIPGVVSDLQTGAQSSMTATFDLAGAAPGVYKLVAQNLEGPSSSLDFAITPGEKAA